MITSPSAISRLRPRDTLVHSVELSRCLDPKRYHQSLSFFENILPVMALLCIWAVTPVSSLPPGGLLANINSLFPQAGWSLLSLAHIKTLDELIIRSLIGLGYLLQYKSRVFPAIATFSCIVVYLVRVASRVHLALPHYLNQELSTALSFANSQVNTIQSNISSRFRPRGNHGRVVERLITGKYCLECGEVLFRLWSRMISNHYSQNYPQPLSAE